MFFFSKPLSIDHLEEQIKVQRESTPPIELRKKIRIAVIDDEDFPPAENLRNNMFNIQHFTDLTALETIKDFPVVLCDLQGVGTWMNRNLQGAHLIQEIKRNTPEKYVLAYTGAATNSVIARVAFDHADKYLKKDASVEEWLNALDDCLKKLTDPVFTWRKFRLRLLEAGMTPEQLVKLEDTFVKSYALGADHASATLSDSAKKWKIIGVVRGVIVEFASSVVFRMMFGDR